MESFTRRSLIYEYDQPILNLVNCLAFEEKILHVQNNIFSDILSGELVQSSIHVKMMNRELLIDLPTPLDWTGNSLSL